MIHPNMKKILILIALLNLAGCASRDYFQNNKLTPVFNLYNRNFIVAAPTRVANYVCGTPFLFVSFALDSVVTGEKSEQYYNFSNGIYLAPATFCGAIIGAVFVPFSYICDEDPWYENFKFYRRSYSCSKLSVGYFERMMIALTTSPLN
jgi:hypothetical protein